MDAEVNGNVLSEGKNLSQLYAPEKLKAVNTAMDELASELLELPKNPADFTVPVTPDSKLKIGESPVSCLPKTLCFTSQDGIILSLNGDSPRTPKETVFDPFAPGPEELLMAPLCKKYSADSKICVARMLNFEQTTTYEGYTDHDADVETMTDEEMLEALNRMLLEIIVSEQAEEFHGGNSIPFSDSDGEDRTPTPAKLLTGTAETCPGAPKKAARISMNIDKGLCKKLEF